MKKLHSTVRRFPAILLVLPVLIVAACIANVREVNNDTERHGWWEQRGPVVPHDDFPGDCTLCHEGDDWHTLREDFSFDHFRETGVELEGAHASAECLRCHNDRGPVEAFASRGCAGCHEDFHQGKLGNSCTDCHETIDWRVKEVIAIHDRTRFPLVGTHASAQCWRCHEGARDGVFTGASADCETCHQDDLARALMPDHAAQGFTSNCDDCHIPTTWGGAAFNHPGFPLTGAHAAADCTSCHANNVFTGTPTDCFACHMPEYVATTNPGHQAAGFPTDCVVCHNTTAWQGAIFDHQSFPLTGAHVAADCSTCHANNVFTGTPTDCFACHMPEYVATTNPGHQAAGFPTDCMVCHNTTAWQGAIFDHDTFALTGAHATADCSACHANNIFTGTPTDCFACHMADYAATTNPGHQAAGFPTDCMICHGTTAWQGAVFDHSSYPLTGAHLAQDCNACHANGTYAGTPTDCYACHAVDYMSTTMPPHSSSGFPTDCMACHTTTAWEGAVFDHDFPITTGKHKNLDCTDCHMVPQDYNVFSCINCHEHNRTDMDKEHKKVNGYVYVSSACYACHPDGKD